MKKTKFYLGLIFFSFLVIYLFEMCNDPDLLVKQDGDIRGYAFVTLKNVENKTREIYLPDVKVEIKNSGGNIVQSLITDLDGGYQTDVLPKGKYEICLQKAGFISACYPIEVMYASNFPGPLEIGMNDENFLYGEVKLKDGQVGFYRNEVFGLDFFTTVTKDLNGTLEKVKCNIFGEYLFVNVPRNVSHIISADCQNANVKQTFTTLAKKLDLTLPSESPIIRGVTAFDAGSPVQRTLPNKSLDVQASVEDADGHNISYTWVGMGDFPGSTFSNNATINWQLPAAPAKYQLYLLVNDNHGGVAYESFDISAIDERVHFSGRAINLAGNVPVPDAQIIINGQVEAVTDANGYFSAAIPQGDTERYVLNIDKPGFMLSSTIHFKDATSKDYKLVPSTTQDFDPNTDIVIVEEEDKFTRISENSREPARIEIPAGSIVDEDGESVTTPVTVSLRTIDLFDPNGLMPGDFGAIQNGQQKRLDSFGAIDVQIRDKANPKRRFNLSPDAESKISIPINFSINNISPQSMVLWDYNETTGLWEEIGNVVKSGNFFRGVTNTFSSLNADVAFNDATCIQLMDNPANSIGGLTVNVKITVPTVGAPKIKTYPNLVIGDLPLIIVRLPPNTNVTIDVTNANTQAPLSTQIVPTRNAIPGPANLNPDPPYTYCNDAFLLPPPLPTVPGNTFLNRINTPSSAEANAYYNLIGATGLTFNQWKTQAGMAAVSNDDFRALYFNAGDLAFWRAMHQNNNSGNQYFYVSNFTRDVDGIDDINPTTGNNPNAIATVAMEYSPITAGGNPVTKFFVFNGAGTLINNADLDGYGPKFIPGLCIECHGGKELTYSSITGGLQNHYDNNLADVPRFLPFDLSSFEFSNKSGSGRSDMEDSLRNLNERVLQTNETTAIRDFIDASYTGSPGSLSGNFNDIAVIGGWSSTTPPHTGAMAPNTFYVDVLGPSCRVCHVSRSTSPPLQFNTSNDFLGSVFNSAVCGSTKYMPNAKVTFVNFWTSTNPHRPEEMIKYLGGTPPCQ